MSDFDELTQAILEFRDNRQWEKYHTPKNLSMSIAIEAAELMEIFQWQDQKHADFLINMGEKAIDYNNACDELADILIYCLLFADTLAIDIEAAVITKLKKNENKYPMIRSR